ncbi:MAG: carboxymuconolactone decarboxylase family protein [Betaproteobacteria bacterium]|jgi:4-carboxymuconolactone decarboxylase
MNKNQEVRIKPIPLDQMTPEQRAVADTLIASPRKRLSGPFNALLRKPPLADRVRQLGDSIRFENSLPDVLREFAITITAKFWSAKYEWHIHSNLAIDLGIDRSVVEAIGASEEVVLTDPDQKLVYQFTHELLHTKEVSDETYDKVLKRFGEVTLIDLMATIGYFGFVSIILNAVRVPLPEGVELKNFK